jgi:hypothetical protein
MKFKEIKIHELKDFIQSDLYKNSINIPITQQRAISQFYNPRAEKEAVALIVALDKSNQIVGFIGALPDYFANKPEIKLAWNSCWWVDNEKGKQTALPLFLKFLSLWDNNVLFRELTPKTLQIIKRLNKFEKVKNLDGYRYFLKFNSADVLSKKESKLKFIKPILQGIDLSLNSFLSLKNKPYKLKKSLKITETSNLDSEAIAFIKNNNKKELFKRGGKELQWILAHKWITNQSKIRGNQYYYFSDKSSSFSNHIIKVYKKSELIAVLFFTNNNGLVKTPYLYFLEDKLSTIIPIIFNFLIKNKAISYITYNKKIINYMASNKNPFWYKKADNRAFYMSKSLLEYVNNDFVFQDGEGDVVFT